MRLPTTPATTLWRELRDEVRQHYRAGRVIVAVDGQRRRGQDDVRRRPRGGLRRGRLGGLPREHRRLPSAARRAVRARAHVARGLLPRLVRLRDLPARPDRPVPRRARRPPAATGFQLAAFDVARDAPVESAWVTAPARRRADRRRDLPPPSRAARTVELVGLARCARRRRPRGCAERDGTDPDFLAAVRTRATATARSSTCATRRPRTAASAIVDNTDLEHPLRVFRDFC